MSTTYEVLVIGAGVSGLGAAMELKKAGITDVLVLEKSDGVGGVWRDNTYPGCACDIPSVIYSYSFAPSREWSRTFAPQPEILDYLETTAKAAGVLDQVRTGVEVTRAEWHATESAWRLTTSAGEFLGRSLIAAAGPWNEATMLDVPGLEGFTGPTFHTSRWDHSVDLAGKRVAIVGTGASAVQVVPSIADEVAELHVFQRTPQWILPKQDKDVPDRARRRGERAAAVVHRLQRGRENATLELVGRLLNKPVGQWALKKAATMNIESAVKDPELRAKLTPDWAIGCKRLLMSNTYYPALMKPHVSLHATALKEVRGDVLVGADGTEVAVDVLIQSTGFKILDMPIADRVYGADGRSLAERWQGSPEAYLGTVIHGYPNLYLVFGPNLGAVTSGFTIVEAQLSQIVQAIQHLRSCGLASLEVRAEVQQRFNDEVQDALAPTVYNSGGCTSYYIDRNGRNGFSWPWSSRRLSTTVGRFDASDYVATTAREPQRA